MEDIVFVLRPHFSKKDIQTLEKKTEKCIAYDGTTYYPGIVGLNNIKANDYSNVVLQALSQVKDIRRFCLKIHLFDDKPAVTHSDMLVQRFGEFMRKIWNPRNFKSHVSPHEMLQAVVLASEKTFQITEQSDPIKFLSWFINALNQNKSLQFKDKNGKKTSVVYDAFQGTMKVYSKKVLPLDVVDDEDKEILRKREEYKETVQGSNFIYLTLDLPSNPLFKNEMIDNIIPQISLSELLMKYGGYKETEYTTYKGSFMKRFVITKLPKYLILYVKRFTQNTFFIEKNPTIVNFPINNVNLGELLETEPDKQSPDVIYDLVANIVHEGEPNKGIYKVHIFHKVSFALLSLLLYFYLF